MGPKEFCWINFDKELDKFEIVSVMYNDFDECMGVKDEMRQAYPDARMFEGIWG